MRIIFLSAAPSHDLNLNSGRSPDSVPALPKEPRCVLLLRVGDNPVSVCTRLISVVPFPPLNAGPCCPNTLQQPLLVVPHPSHLILQPIKFIWPSHRTRLHSAGILTSSSKIWNLEANPALRATSLNHSRT